MSATRAALSAALASFDPADQLSAAAAAGADVVCTRALGALPNTALAAASLCNLALCSLRTGVLHDALAAAAASLQLQPTVKGFHRAATALALLGEFDLADQLLAKAARYSGDGFGPKQQELCTCLRRDVGQAKQGWMDGYPRDTLAAMCNGAGWGGLVGEWVATGRVGTRFFEGKGRGVHALRHIEEGETLLVQRARSSVLTDTVASKEVVTSINSESRKFDDASKLKLKAQLTAAATTDALLASVLVSLDDGSGRANLLVPLEELLVRLSPAVLPLLLQQPRFLPPSERIEVGHARICGIVDTNSHGGVTSAEWNKVRGSRTSLFPAISLFNHAHDPDCTLVRINEDSGVLTIAVTALRPIPEGAELTVSYTDDKHALKTHWGIEP